LSQLGGGPHPKINYLKKQINNLPFLPNSHMVPAELELASFCMMIECLTGGLGGRMPFWAFGIMFGSF